MSLHQAPSEADSSLGMATQSLNSVGLSDTATFSDSASISMHPAYQGTAAHNLYATGYSQQRSAALPNPPPMMYQTYRAQEASVTDYQQVQALNVQLQVDVLKLKNAAQEARDQARGLEQECEQFKQQEKRLQDRVSDLEHQVERLQERLAQQQVVILFADNQTTPDVRKIETMVQKKTGRSISLSSMVIMFDNVPPIALEALAAEQASNPDMVQQEKKPVAVASTQVQTNPVDVSASGVRAGEGRTAVDPAHQGALVGTGATWSAVAKPAPASAPAPAPAPASVTTGPNMTPPGPGGDRPMPQVQPQPVIAPVTSSTAAPAHPLVHDMITTYRPHGDGPAPYHVTIRFLRPSVTEADLLSLARETISLAKIFYPPLNLATHVGRAATYFFHDRQEAFAFCMTLRNKNDLGELENTLRLTLDDLYAAQSRGVASVWLERMSLPRLIITMSDPRKRSQWQARAEGEQSQVPQHRKYDGAVAGRRTSAGDDAGESKPRPANPFEVLQETESQSGHHGDDDDADHIGDTDQDYLTE